MLNVLEWEQRILSIIKRQHHLVLHYEVCLGGTELEGGLLEVVALVSVGEEERGGDAVCSQVLDQELLALLLQAGAVVLGGEQEGRGDRVRGQPCC